MRRPPRQAAARACLILVLARLALWTSPAPAEAGNPALKLAKAHFTRHGARLPTPALTAALRAAAADISHLSCRKSLVLISMANDGAFTQTVPPFLDSLSSVRAEAGGLQAGQSLDSHLVLVTLSKEAQGLCRALQAKGYRHQCVRDPDHQAAAGSFSFHSTAFNSLGFNRVKYILHGLSAGHDVVFLDLDVVLLRDPLPYLLSRRAHMLGSLEKCLIYNATLASHSPEFLALRKRPPPLNVGVVYFRATAGVARCVYAWLWDMFCEVPTRPLVWEQDVYGKVMHRCAAAHSLHWAGMDPRLVQSGCFSQCGCTYADADASPSRISKPGAAAAFLGAEKEYLCGPQHWAGWLLKHFACSGTTQDKVTYMTALRDGVRANTTARITHRTWA